MYFLRATYRLIFFGIGSLFYIFRYLTKAIFLGDDLDRAIRLRKSWFKRICKGIGVHIETFGTPPEKGGLLVSNHRSYFDPVVVLSEVLAIPVGKAEIKSWPIIGWGAKVTGAIFVERKSKEGRMRTRQNIRQMLKKGYCIMNYPEGKTHTRPKTVRFKPGMFRDAASEGFRIYPIALEYQKDSDAFIGTDNFIGHFFNCFGRKRINIRIKYGAEIISADADALIQESKAWIDAELVKLRANWHQSAIDVA